MARLTWVVVMVAAFLLLSGSTLLYGQGADQIRERGINERVDQLYQYISDLRDKDTARQIDIAILRTQVDELRDNARANRNFIYGIGAMVLGNALLAAITLSRVGRVRDGG